MIVRQRMAARISVAQDAPPWPPFVVAALVFALTVGTLSGALDLWSLRVKLLAVPVDHARSHAFAQVFGLFWLLIAGVSLHLCPRFFGAAPAGRGLVRGLKWTAIPAMVLLIAGRLGSLLPGSSVLGVLGALLLLVAMILWAGFVSRLWAEGQGPKDALHAFVAAGTGWWVLAAVGVVSFHLGQLVKGPWSAIPLESVWAMALYGGTASWLFGIFLRAGMCTLHLARPEPAAQSRLFWIWQSATGLAAAAAAVNWAPLRVAAGVGLAVAVLAVLRTFRPFTGRELGQEGTLVPRAIQLGFGFLLVFGVLAALGAVASGTAWAGPIFLTDSTRHSFTLGTCLLMVLGFAGRMVPGFSSVTLRWPKLYDAGVVFVSGGAALRLLELWAPQRWAMACSGASGGIVFLGLAAVASTLLASIWLGARVRRQQFEFAQADDVRLRLTIR